MRSGFAIFICCVLSGCSHLATYKEAEISNILIDIPATTVTLGSSRSQRIYAHTLGGITHTQAYWIQTETKRKVKLNAFRINKYPVTHLEYKEYLNASGLRRHLKVEDHGHFNSKHSVDKSIPYLWHENEYASGLDNHPVVLITEQEAQAYCQWLGRQNDSAVGRLPTEDEWELAARGPDAKVFPWDDQWSAVRLNSASIGPGHITHVNRYIHGVSPYGLYDMAGNLFQWTSTEVQNGEKKIIKGCAWHSLPAACRSAARAGRTPDTRDIDIGFRCVVEAQ